MSILEKLKDGLINGYIDKTRLAEEEYKPKLIINDVEKSEKVLTTLNQELLSCDRFYFNVAFVTSGGVTSLLNTFIELEKRNVKGIIIASQYQNFSQPKALEKLLNFKNIELRIVPNDSFKLHSKAYIFQKNDTYSIIIGSSNLTSDALCTNKEWNIKVFSNIEGSFIKQTLKEYDEIYNISIPVTKNWLEIYSHIYYQFNNLRNTNTQSILPPHLLHKINPNKMQADALEELQKTRESGNNRGIIISATGTGKTYLSAFDVRRFNPERFLFVVHREIIAEEALNSFKRVIGEHVSMGILGGGKKDIDSKYIFSTIQTISKDDVLYSFKKDEFDYIVIDEVHRAGAPSYKKILDYFEPKFLLGMTATPERTDGEDIYSLFEHNVAYEIRLNHAMKENLVCPFHYFGITDLTIGGNVVDDNSDFRYLEAEERVNNIIEKAEFYGYSGERVKGLIFCSRNDEAKILSNKFNEKGFSTIALSGADSNEARENAIGRLEQNYEDNKLDYIFTVDIFNEGVDIPAVNQIIMLRPTESAIIFVQQLGRGLRHYKDKEYVIVLDFIGSYQKNFFIPMALSGDKTYNKDNLRKFVTLGTRVIPGASTVNFDEISKNRIFSAIDSARFNENKVIIEAYNNLKVMLGRIPELDDFDNYGSIDPIRIFYNKNFGSYHNFLKKNESRYNVELTSTQEKFLEFVSKKIVVGKRPHELILLKILLSNDNEIFSKLSHELNLNYNILLNEIEKNNIFNIMTSNFIQGTGKDAFKDCIFLEEDLSLEFKEVKISKKFKKGLGNQEFRNALTDLIQYGLKRNAKDFGERYKDTNFQLYQKYTYEDVCQLLNWEKGIVAQNIGGYKYDEKTNTYPVFINYHKEEDISDTIKYEDRFISPQELIAISKSRRKLSSKDVVQALNAKQLGIEMHLFVRKNKDDNESKEFYYLGFIEATGEAKEIVMGDTGQSAVEIHYKLETSVREDIYSYITN